LTDGQLVFSKASLSNDRIQQNQDDGQQQLQRWRQKEEEDKHPDVNRRCNNTDNMLVENTSRKFRHDVVNLFADSG
jgi:hypothetical protein